MKFQRKLSNGDWVAIEDAEVNMFLKNTLKRQAEIAKIHETAAPTMKDIIEKLKAGKRLEHGTDWYEEIRREKVSEPVSCDFPDGKVLDCGHTVYSKSEIMNAYGKTTCADCYSMMADI
jgi:hypothetical protein